MAEIIKECGTCGNSHEVTGKACTTHCPNIPGNMFTGWIPREPKQEEEVRSCHTCRYSTAYAKCPSGCDELPTGQYPGWEPIPTKTLIGVNKEDSPSPGQKFDDGKPDMTYLRYLKRALMAVVRVMEAGGRKYSRGDFLHVPDAVRRYDAAQMRHWLEDPTEIVEDLNEFSPGVPLSHEMCNATNALFKLEIRLREEEQNANEESKEA